MATKRRSKNPKDWDGAEKRHSLSTGDTVKVSSFGAVTEAKVEALSECPSTDLPTYDIRFNNGSYVRHVGFFEHPLHGWKLLSKI